MCMSKNRQLINQISMDGSVSPALVYLWGIISAVIS